MSEGKLKLRINWAFRDGSRWFRGHDTIETKDPDFDKVDADELMQRIMFPCESEDIERMPNFAENINADSPQDWKVLSIREEKKKG